MESVPEIRRERVSVPPDMNIQELMQKYDLPYHVASRAKKFGFFVKNYSKKQIIIDPENFDPTLSYATARKVFGKNFSKSQLAQILREDLVQEAVTRMYELSGKVKENANGKYGIGYGYFWVAHNAMLSFLKSWEKQNKWCESFEELANPILRDRRRIYSPDWGWMYV